MARGRARGAVALIAATVGTLGVIADVAGRVGFWSEYIPRPFRPYIPVLYLVGFLIALTVLRAESLEPRLIFDFEFGRANPGYLDTVDIYPYFIRNDGSDTALQIKIKSPTVGDARLILLPQRSSALPTEEVGVRIYIVGGIGGQEGGRVDHDLEKALLPLIKHRIKAGATDRVEIQLDVRIEYENHHGRRYVAPYCISIGAHPRDGEFQMELPRVIRDAKAKA